MFFPVLDALAVSRVRGRHGNVKAGFLPYFFLVFSPKRLDWA
jgi:hypothetical protein